MKSTICSSKIQLISELNNNYELIDIVGINVNTGSNNLIVLCIYIPPCANQQHYKRFFSDLTAILLNLQGHLLVMADFNMPSFRASQLALSFDRKAEPIFDFCHILELKQYNNNNNLISNTLDLVFSNLDCTVTPSCDELVATEICHHPLIDINMSISYNNFQVNDNSPPKYNFKKSNFDLTLLELSMADWTEFYLANDVNTLVDHLYHNIHLAVDKTVPKFEVRNNIAGDNYPKWFNKDLIELIKRRNTTLQKIEKLLKNSRNSSRNNIALLKLHNNKLKKKIKHNLLSAQSKFHNNIEKHIVANPTEFWNYLNNIKKKTRVSGNFLINNSDCSDQDIIVNKFANYFLSTYVTNNVNPINNSNNSANNMNNTNNSVDSLGGKSRVTYQEVLKAFNSLPGKFSSGMDGLPCKLIKHCKGVLAGPLLAIINKSLISGIYPTIWKQAKVIPVHKKGPKNIITNYRPISILSALSQVFEMCLYNIIYAYFSPVISDCQHGFLPRRSTATNLINFTNYIHSGFTSNCRIDPIYTDFSKAFDKIDIISSLDKLDILGLPTELLRLSTSYLINRKCYVLIGNFFSNPFVPTSGVPQGSNLGPLLFLIYINNICLSVNCQLLLYANDAKLFSRVYNLDDSTALQKNLDCFSLWCKNNSLYLNADKCFVISYHRKKDYLDFGYTIDGLVIRREFAENDLGVKFDCHPTSRVHIDSTVAKSLKLIGFVF